MIPAVCQAWWNDEWNYRKEITLDLSASGAAIDGNAADVPVLIRLHVGNFGYFADTKADGADLRFVAGDDKTPLKHHVERFDAANQMAFVWVRVPQLAGGASEKIHLYYGNPTAAAGDDASGTFDASQVLVYHFSDAGTAPADATAFRTAAGRATIEPNAASLIGGGARFGGGAAGLSIPATAALRLLPDKGLTVSAWIKVEAAQANATVFELAEAGKRLALTLDGLVPVVDATDTAGTAVNLRAAQPLAAAQWVHLALVYGAGTLSVYANGAEVATTQTNLPEIAGTLNVGNSDAGSTPLAGELDELQVANSARTPAWLGVAARSQGLDARLVGYGTDAQREGGDVSYLKVTMQNVTADGWVVIVILGVMFVIAMIIIVGKALYLSGIAKQNARFMREFEKLRSDLTALDSEDADDTALDRSPFLRAGSGDDKSFALSTLYRLYHHGVQEMTARARAGGNGKRGPLVLTPQSMASIRAAMDATSVRMTQKLTSQMVLLTIAISGGPFLGLLGTVVGVMITFAAIAASGDVNVNSIAPGIAAALAATVAGLAVAIPALFGYNWLNTRIKEINADMRVFVDEFVTRAAERYS
jgi:biopolymer transport protein ExbB